MLKTLKRVLGLHPLRRDTDRPARSTAELIEQIRRDRYSHGRRHDDVVATVRAKSDSARIAANRRQLDLFAEV